MNEERKGLTVQALIDELTDVVRERPSAAGAEVTVQYRGGYRGGESQVVVMVRKGEVVGVRIDAPPD